LALKEERDLNLADFANKHVDFTNKIYGCIVKKNGQKDYFHEFWGVAIALTPDIAPCMNM